MPASRLAFVLAIAAAASWTLKAIAIGTAGGLGKSPLEGPLFLLGLVLALSAAAVAGVAITRGRHVGIRVIGAIGGLLFALALALGSDALAGAVMPKSTGWVEAEAGLWLSALIMVSLTFVIDRRAPGRVHHPQPR